jgi:hypothetical protein
MGTGARNEKQISTSISRFRNLSQFLKKKHKNKIVTIHIGVIVI